MTALKLRLQKFQGLIISYIIAVILFIAISVFIPGFASLQHISVIFCEASIIGIVAIGQTFVIITGGIDMSVAWIFCISAIMITNITGGSNEKILTVWPLIIILTLIFGFINGFCIAYLRMPAIVMTLGMNTVLQGGLVAITQGAPGGKAPEAIQNLGQGRILGIPNLIWIWMLLIVIVLLIMFKTKYGRELFAVGNNSVVAKYSGINSRKVIMIAYIISGFTAGLAGILQAGKVGSSYLSMGDNFQFQSIAAVAIGGTSLSGGNGNYLGTVAGAFTITIILAILSALNLPYGVQRMAYGIVVLISVLFSVSRGKRRK